MDTATQQYLTAPEISRLLKRRTGVYYTPDNVRNRLLRRTRKICPVPAVYTRLPRRDSVAWPLDRYPDVEAHLLDRDQVGQPVTDSELEEAEVFFARRAA